MNHRGAGWNTIPRSRSEWDPRGMALSAREEWARDTEVSKNWSFLQLSQFGFLTHHPEAFSLRLNNMGGVATLLNFLTFLLKDSWPRWCSVTFYNSSGVKIRAAIGGPPPGGRQGGGGRNTVACAVTNTFAHFMPISQLKPSALRVYHMHAGFCWPLRRTRKGGDELFPHFIFLWLSRWLCVGRPDRMIHGSVPTPSFLQSKAASLMMNSWISK